MMTKGELISHIITAISLLMMLAGIVYFIVLYTNTANEIKNALPEAVDEIVTNNTGNFIKYIGLNFLLSAGLGAVGAMIYAFFGKSNGKIILTKVGLAVLPTVLLVIFIIIWMTLK